MKANITIKLPQSFQDTANELASQSYDASAIDDALTDLFLEDAAEIVMSALADGTGSIEFTE